MYNYHLSYKLSNTELSETIVLQKAKKCLVEISFSLNFRIKYVQVVKIVYYCVGKQHTACEIYFRIRDYQSFVILNRTLQ